MVNIQKRPPPMENAAAIQVVARKDVFREALTPYTFATDSMEPTVMEPKTVDITDAATMDTVERPETMKVRQDPAREQMAKMPTTSSIAQVIKAII